ncbi:MAG TPA: hypothetical protein VN259_10220 [Xanthomonadales bacterium]|nr:hypothetical protein [Xanthomonadales bacterium]
MITSGPHFSPSDDELVMFHFGEDLGPERMEAIAMAITDDPRLQQRYQELRRLLGASGAALAVAEPGPDFEQRLWRKLAPQLEPAAKRRPIWLEWLVPGLALAASLGMGIVIGRQWQPAAAPDAPIALDAAAQDRVLAAHLARHLGQTERLLRVAENGDLTGADPLAAVLIESNRLYASAAERAGKPALAQFLSELEPILRELANGDDADLGGTALAREQIRSRDLLYRLRALQTLQATPTQTL